MEDRTTRKQLGVRAAKLGYKLKRRKDRYELRAEDGTGSNGDWADLGSELDDLEAFDRGELQYLRYTACGRPIGHDRQIEDALTDKSVRVVCWG
jgi:hypothetical protein